MENMLSFKTVNLKLLGLLLAVILIASIAAVPAVLPEPNAPTAVATANAGELHVAWDTVPGARFYTVGWINRNDFLSVGSGGEWLSEFHYATVPASRTSYTVSGLKAGEEYWTIVGARRQRDGGDATRWSASWSGLVTTSGQHGEGFCPITGLPLPPEGYLSVGDVVQNDFGDQFRLDAVEEYVPTDDDGEEAPAPLGWKYVAVCATVAAGSEYSLTVHPGSTYNLDTDVGLGFLYDSTWWSAETVAPGDQAEGCDLWQVSEDASNVVVALYYWQQSPTLYLVGLAESVAQ